MLPENNRILGLPTVIVKMPLNYSTQDPKNNYSSSRRSLQAAAASSSLDGISELDEDTPMHDIETLKNDESALIKQSRCKDTAGEWEHDVVAGKFFFFFIILA